MKNLSVRPNKKTKEHTVHIFIFLLFTGILNIHGSVLLADEFRAYPTSIVFNEIEGNTSGTLRSVFLFSSTDGGALDWSLSKNASWITTDITNGITQGVLKVGVNTTSLQHGTYTGNVVLHAPLSTAADVVVSVTLIINQDVPVIAASWKDGFDAAMTVSVDDSYGSGYSALQANGFSGTYYLWDVTPPSFAGSYYNTGMELGCHTVNHPCFSVSDDRLRNMEFIPNINAVCTKTPEPCKDVISFAWPCGFTNYREQAIASDYFLSARGYNINMLEDQEPDNFMNLKSYNSHEHTPYPPSDLKTVVDLAISQKKWFNLVLHSQSNDDGATNYAASKSIWVTSIGNVIKYILQRERLIMTDYVQSSSYTLLPALIPVTVSPIPVPT